MRNRLQQLGTIMLITIVGTVLLFAAARAQGGDRDRMCINHARQMSFGLYQYTNDYDEQFPPMRNAQEIQERIEPYVPNAAVFFCPVTHTGFAPNAALSGRSISSVGNDYYTIAVLSDALPHANGQPTIAFLDGHAERGGVDLSDPNETCVNNARQLASAVLMYANDWDEVLPPTQSAEAFRAVMSPYVRSQRVFTCPDTQLLYTPNAALSGVLLPSISDPDTTESLRDTQPHRDGLSTVAFLDGHVERGGVDPADPNKTCVNNARRLLWAVYQYAYDHDDLLPPMQNVQAFRTALSPYVRGQRPFVCPDTQIPYTPNAVLSGVSFSNIPDFDAAEVLRDAQPHRDGLTTIAYLSGRVVRESARRSTTTGRRSPRGSSQRRSAGD